MSVTTLKTELKTRAILDYENLCWRCVDDNALMHDSATCGPILYAAEKSLEDFAADIEALQTRVALAPEIDKFKQARVKKAELDAEREKLVGEFAKVQAEHDTQLAALDEKIGAEKKTQTACQPALKHFLSTAPQAMREKLKSVSHKIYDLQREQREKPPHGKPANPEKTLLLPAQDQAERDRMQESFARKLSEFDARVAEYEQRQKELPDLLAAAEQERKEITEAMLELRT